MFLNTYHIIMKKRIVFTGGGTLGHVMPNVYLIKELIDDYDCAYIGSGGIEKDRIEKFNIELARVNLSNNLASGKTNLEINSNQRAEVKDENLKTAEQKVEQNAGQNFVDFRTIPVVKFNRGKILGNLKIPFALIRSIHSAKKVLKEVKPDVIFSKGGYVALPVCLAGRMLRIPIVAHESDSSFGLANRIILRLCKTMCVNFKNLEGKNKKIVYTGPIFSNEFEKTNKRKTDLNLIDGKPTLLVVGGSLGSQKINDMLLPIIKDLIVDFNVIHLTGKGNLKMKSFDNYNALETSDDMVNLYNIADFVLGRSGAGVTAECFYKKLPMILIPLENKASRGDQLMNAKYYENQRVATILRERDLTPTKLLSTIQNFYKNLTKYKSSYQNLKNTNGRQKIIEIIKKY